MPELRVWLLGGLALAWGDDPLAAIPSATARSLLAYLVTTRGRPQPRDLLAGIFWPDLPDATARRRLSQALWKIGRALSPLPVVLAEGDAVQINPGLPLWLDVQELEAAGSAAEVEPPRLERVAALYGGEFLAGYYDDWALVERERLRDLFLSILERLIAAAKRQGEYEKALVAARRLAAEDPWREEAHREVMRLCHLLGRDAEALKQFEICRRVLAEELGGEPAPETLALAQEIGARSGLAGPPLLPATARPAGAPFLERPDLLPLVGRGDELAELLRQVEAAARGSGGLCLLYGEAGVGKSRLLRELAANGEWRAVRVAWGNCYELAAPLAYQPLLEALRACLPALVEAPLDSPWLAALAPLLPEVAACLPAPSPEPQRPSRQPSFAALPPEEERRRLLEALAQAFLALSAKAPHLVVLEDVHWMDQASLDALRYLLPRLPGSRLLLVLSARPGELASPTGSALAAMEGTGLPQRLDLGRLGQAETGELVARALELAHPAPRFSARLYAETEGNPFFVVEMLRTLVDEGLLYRDEADGWTTAGDLSADGYAELPLAAGVQQSIGRRLARLPAALGGLIGLASVIGRGVDFDLWQAASGLSDEAMLAAGDDLCARGLLRVEGGAGADYSFAHDQIRRVVYEGLSPARRRLYHRRAAEALAALAPAEPAVLAYHCTRAEDWVQAAVYHRVAGDQARAVYAHGEAASHYAQALTALAQRPGPADPGAEFALRLAREAALGWQGERAAQARELTALEALGSALDDGGPEAAGRRAEVALRRVRYATVTADYAAAIGAAGEAMDLALRARDREQEARAHLVWGQVLWHQAVYDAARAQLQVALALASAAGLEPVVADCHLALGRVCLAQGAYAAAREYLAQASELYRQAGDPRGEAESLEYLGRLSRLQGDNEASPRYFEEALRVSRQVGDRRGESRALYCLGAVAVSTGDYARADSALRQALTIAEEIGDLEAQSTVLGTLGALMNRRCAYEPAAAYYERSLRLCREIGDRRTRLSSLMSLAIALYCRGDYGRAVSLAEEAWKLGGEIGDRRYAGWAQHTLGRLAVRLGRDAEAEARYAQALAIAQELGDRQLEAVVLYSAGLHEHGRGDEAAALALAGQALAIAQEIGEPVEEAYALTNLGRALAGSGRPDEAAAAFRQAAVIRRRLGQHSLAAESLAGLAWMAQALGALAEARANAEEVLAILDAGPPEGTEEPFWLYLVCYRVLLAAGDARCDRVLAAGYELLQQQAARIADDGLRHSFLEGVAAHREIAAAHRQRQAAGQAGGDAIGQMPISLPRCEGGAVRREGGAVRREGGAVRREGGVVRREGGEGPVAVLWTVEMPEDEAIAGKVARRRHRLRRLLAQAQAQGAAPTHQDLADALGVSRHTIERDLAALGD